jgi:hypothetical protein
MTAFGIGRHDCLVDGLGEVFSVFMVFSVEDRYREPIMPVPWVMAAIAVEAAYRQWRPREGSSRAVLGASILGKLGKPAGRGE